MGRIPEETIHEIRDRIDIVGLVGRYVDLKKAGRNFKGLCPFHDEKTPSFNVNPDRQIFHCFGCGEGGGAFQFLMSHEGLIFPEAVRTLARELGIEIPEDESGGEPGVMARLVAANDVAQKLYRQTLASDAGAVGRAYLSKRGLDRETIDRFGIGFAPDRWDALTNALAKAKVPAEIGERAGLLKARRQDGGARGGQGSGHYDHLRGRVVFPIFDVRGQVIGFGGRAMADDQQPKYLNTPETPLFRKREALYGFPSALEPVRRAERAIVCEGYFDQIALHRAGLAEALATCGTALTPEHGRQLKRRTRKVVLLFDGDAAGQKAVERALEVLLPEGLRVRAATLPAGDDPDTYLEAHGAPALREVVDEAPDALEVVTRAAVAIGCATPAEKADATSRVAHLVALVENPVERAEYTRRLAMATGSDEAAVEVVVREAARASRRGRTPSERSAAERRPEAEPLRVQPRRDTLEDRHLCRLTSLLARRADLATPAVRDQLAEVLPEGSWKALALCLVDAAEAGRTDSTGGVDLFSVEQQLDSDARARLMEAAVADTEFQAGAPLEGVLVDMISWFQKRRRVAAGADTTRKLRANDSTSNAAELIAEKQRQLEERRAARRIS